MSSLTKEQKTLVYQRTKRAFRKYTLLKKGYFLLYVIMVFVIMNLWDALLAWRFELSPRWRWHVLLAVILLIGRELPLFLIIRNRFQVKELQRSERVSVQKAEA